MMEKIGSIQSTAAVSTAIGQGKTKTSSLFTALMATLGKGFKLGADGKAIKGTGTLEEALHTQVAKGSKAKSHDAKTLLVGQKDTQIAGDKHATDKKGSSLLSAKQNHETGALVSDGVQTKGRKTAQSHATETHIKTLKSETLEKNTRSNQSAERKSLAERLQDTESDKAVIQIPSSDIHARKQTNSTDATSTRFRQLFTQQSPRMTQGKEQQEIHINAGKTAEKQIATQGISADAKVSNGKGEANNGKGEAKGSANAEMSMAEATSKAAKATRMAQPRATTRAAEKTGKTAADNLQEIMATAVKTERQASRIRQSFMQRTKESKKNVLLKSQSVKAEAVRARSTSQTQALSQTQTQPDIKDMQFKFTPVTTRNASADLSMMNASLTANLETSAMTAQQASNVSGPQTSTSTQALGVSTATANTRATGNTAMQPSTAPNTGPWTVMMAMQEIGQQAAQGKTRLELRLEPAHLGKIKVVLESNAQKEIQVRMVVEQNQSRQLIEQNMPLLRQSLEQQGLNLGNFSMHGGEQQQHSANNRKQQAASDASPGQRENMTGIPNMQSAVTAATPYISGRLSIHI